MKICIPVNENNGINSTICEHFGSAPLFMIVDTNTLSVTEIKNDDQHHAHGMCQPLSVLGNYEFDGIVVGGIGAGALNKLKNAGITVYRTEYSNINETISAYNNNKLKEMDQNNVCSHYGHTCK